MAPSPVCLVIQPMPLPLTPHSGEASSGAVGAGTAQVLAPLCVEREKLSTSMLQGRLCPQEQTGFS